MMCMALYTVLDSILHGFKHLCTPRSLAVGPEEMVPDGEGTEGGGSS